MMTEKIIKTTHYKLILILDQLEPKEWRALKKFVLMYTRELSDNFNLFTLLRKNIDRLNTNADVKNLHAEHFPQMTSKTFFNMFSRLTLWVEDWMVYEDMRKSDQRDIRLIRLYNSRGLYKESNAIANKAIKTAKNKPGLSLMATENLAKIYYYQYFSNNPIKYQDKELLKKMIAFELKRCKNILMIFQNQSLFFKRTTPNEKEQHNNILNSTIKLLPSSDLTELLSITKSLITNDDFDSLIKIKQSLKNNEILLKSDLHTLTTMYAFSTTPRLWARNKFKDPQIVIDTLNYAIESGVILSDEKIETVLWHNMITIISITKEYKKAKEFIERWHTKVNTKNSLALKSLSMAQLCFHQEKFHEIRDHIYQMKSIEPEHKERANSLIVIALYHDRKKNYKLFTDYAHNLLRQLKRSKSKISKSTFEGYSNLTKTLIALAKSSFSESEIIIEHSQHLIYRTWLRKEIKKGKH